MLIDCVPLNMGVVETSDAAAVRPQVADLAVRALAGLLPADAERVLGDVQLVASELVANTVHHAGGLLHFRASALGDRLRMEVTDASPHHPRTSALDPGTPGGFGWRLVHRLCTGVRVDSGLHGKTIVVDMHLA
ncbi:ATP-binding protein [Streptomyces sp. NPDC088785]|uniref:ATP-binding protein n=1 Tax=Streptomyces sp. NPDC088785 TaxID=3365897 RepID=UPI00380ACE7B